jgi:CheY-like chemotaxis protein
MPSVLIVEDDAYVRECLFRGFVAEGWRAWQVADPGEALGWIQVQCFDLVVADVLMPRMTGTELVRRIRALKPDLPAILMSGYPEAFLRRQACETAVAPLLQKPFQMKTLLERASTIVAQKPAVLLSEQPPNSEDGLAASVAADVG